MASETNKLRFNSEDLLNRSRLSVFQQSGLPQEERLAEKREFLKMALFWDSCHMPLVETGLASDSAEIRIGPDWADR